MRVFNNWTYPPKGQMPTTHLIPRLSLIVRIGLPKPMAMRSIFTPNQRATNAWPSSCKPTTTKNRSNTAATANIIFYLDGDAYYQPLNGWMTDQAAQYLIPDFVGAPQKYDKPRWFHYS